MASEPVGRDSLISDSPSAPHNAGKEFTKSPNYWLGVLTGQLVKVLAANDLHDAQTAALEALIDFTNPTYGFPQSASERRALKARALEAEERSKTP
jgi:hypothetical protein